MARTRRNRPQDLYYRSPRHLSEERTLKAILKDSWVDKEIYQLGNISGLNRIRKRIKQLPEAWYDDLPIAAYYEEDYRVSA